MKTKMGGIEGQSVAEFTKEAKNLVGATENKSSSSGASWKVGVPEGEYFFCRYCLRMHKQCFVEDEDLAEELDQKLVLGVDCEGFQRSAEEQAKEMTIFESFEEELIKTIMRPIRLRKK